MGSPDDRQIIELRPEKPDRGEIRYRYSGGQPSKPSPLSAFAWKIFGVLTGVALFLLFIFFFVYVVLPVIALLLIWMFLRNLFRKS